MRFLGLSLTLCLLALCFDVTESWTKFEKNQSISSNSMDGSVTKYFSYENEELEDSHTDYSKKYKCYRPIIYFESKMNNSLLYHENKSYRLECVAKNISSGVLTLTDHQNNTSTNNKRGTNILTISWENILHKADDGKTIVCNLQCNIKINGSTNFKDVNVTITLRLIEEDYASNISKAQFINGSKSLVPELIGGILTGLIGLMMLAVIIIYQIRKKRTIDNARIQTEESIYAMPYVHYATLDLQEPSNLQVTSERSPYAKIIGILKQKNDMSK